MLKRLRSLELPMTHINHWWSLYTAYECVVMMILPLHHYLTHSCDTNAGPGVTYAGLLSSSPLRVPSHFLYLCFLHHLVSSRLLDSFRPNNTHALQHSSYLPPAPLSGPCWPWTGPCQAESRWLKEKGYTHYTD